MDERENEKYLLLYITAVDISPGAYISRINCSDHATFLGDVRILSEVVVEKNISLYARKRTRKVEICGVSG